MAGSTPESARGRDHGAETLSAPDSPGAEGLTYDLSGALTYGRYLDLERLLQAQHPRSGEHDELLFIVIHQSTELWIKLALHELSAARARIGQDDLEPAFKMMARVGRIQAQMIQSWEILSTMTPADYHRFRAYLGPSSGFQSRQYRMLEFILGGKSPVPLKLRDGDAEGRAALERASAEPSLYDEALRLLDRRGFAIPRDRLTRDFTQPYEASPVVEAAWLEIYRDVERHWDLYELGEKLVDLDYRFQQWRFAHLKTVERIIGFKRGTGGSAGVAYLARALDQGFFPELLSLRTAI